MKLFCISEQSLLQSVPVAARKPFAAVKCGDADEAFRDSSDTGEGGRRRQRLLYMSPRGKVLNQKMIEELSAEDELTILCGHYEGVDQRVLDYFGMEEVSIGDYVLTGGELPLWF